MRSSAPSERPNIEKLRACLVQLEAALLLMMRDYDPVPPHTLLGASKGILRGLHRVKPCRTLSNLDESISRLVRPGFMGEWYKYERRAANFFKHADRDPFETLDGVDLAGVNLIEAVICTLAVWEYVERLPETLVIGLIFISDGTQSWFDYHGHLNDTQEGRRIISQMSEMSGERRRLFLLGVFETAHDSGINAANCPLPVFDAEK